MALSVAPDVDAAQGVHARARTRIDSSLPERDPGPSDPDKAHRKEYQVKAALLFKFLQYTTFPKGAFKDKKAPIVITIVGDDPFGDLLESTFKGKKIHARDVTIKRTKKVPAALDAHLVFAGGLNDKERAKLIELSKDRRLLLVGETPGFAAAGGFINLVKKKRKLSFEINTDRQKDTGLKLKAGLLKVADIVKTEKAARSGSRRSSR